MYRTVYYVHEGGGGGRKKLAEIRWQDKKAGKANEEGRKKEDSR
jgi:hypothetical protein